MCVAAFWTANNIYLVESNKCEAVCFMHCSREHRIPLFYWGHWAISRGRRQPYWRFGSFSKAQHEHSVTSDDIDKGCHQWQHQWNCTLTRPHRNLEACWYCHMEPELKPEQKGRKWWQRGLTLQHLQGTSRGTCRNVCAGFYGNLENIQ